MMDTNKSELLRKAVNRGYHQGFLAGQTDRSNRRASNHGISHVYRSGSYGFHSDVDAVQYRNYFQLGFRRGYEEGYNIRNKYHSNTRNGLNVLDTILHRELNSQEI